MALKMDRSILQVAALLGGVSLTAFAQNAVPDAQVEANVLKALASAPELANEAITTGTVYGTVTLSGSVRDEATRRRAENLAANADGVKKVLDELQLGSATSGMAPTAAVAAGQVLQSDGTYAAADAGLTPGSAPAGQAQRNDPDADQQLDQQMEQQQGGTAGQAPMNGQAPVNAGGNAGTPPAQGQVYPDGRRPLTNGYPQSYPQQYPQSSQQGYPQSSQQGYPQSSQQGYPPYGAYPPAQQGQGQQGYGAPQGRVMYGGQVGGQAVTVPAGTLVRVRVNRTLSSNHSQIGSAFDGEVVNDVVAAGVVAIPRGASVQGTVVDAKSSGVLKGRGELSVQLTSVTLAGKSFPLQTELWAHHGGDKSIETLDKTAGFGALGAVFGALAGGGVGAAVGGGVGAAAGLGSSAASGRGQVFVPAEGMLAFNLAQPAAVTTVSEQEMQRLAYGVPAGAGRRYGGPGYAQPGYYPYGAPDGYPR